MLLNPANMLYYDDSREGVSIEKLGGDAGVYSLSIPAQDVVCTWMLFAAIVPVANMDMCFDSVRVSFIDQRDRKRSFIALSIDGGARLGQPKEFHDLAIVTEAVVSFR